MEEMEEMMVEDVMASLMGMTLVTTAAITIGQLLMTSDTPPACFTLQLLHA